jgi:hypothetical protein
LCDAPPCNWICQARAQLYSHRMWWQRYSALTESQNVTVSPLMRFCLTGPAIFQVIQHLLHYRVKIEYKLLAQRFFSPRTKFTIHKYVQSLSFISVCIHWCCNQISRQFDSSGHNPSLDESDKSISSMSSHFYGR